MEVPKKNKLKTESQLGVQYWFANPTRKYISVDTLHPLQWRTRTPQSPGLRAQKVGTNMGVSKVGATQEWSSVFGFSFKPPKNWVPLL